MDIDVADGTYDAFVVDAEVRDDGDHRITHLELTIIAGEHKGEVVAVAATGMTADEIDLIGMPATLTVTDGRPSVTIDT